METALEAQKTPLPSPTMGAGESSLSQHVDQQSNFTECNSPIRYLKRKTFSNSGNIFDADPRFISSETFFNQPAQNTTMGICESDDYQSHFTECSPHKRARNSEVFCNDGNIFDIVPVSDNNYGGELEPTTKNVSNTAANTTDCNRDTDPQMVQKQITKDVKPLYEIVKDGDAEKVSKHLKEAAHLDGADIDDALTMSLRLRNLPTAIPLLNYIVKEIKRNEDGNAMQVYAAYYEEDRWKPIFVLLEKKFSRGEMRKWRCWDMYCRRFDYVSTEAGKVMESDAVLDNLISLSDMEDIKAVVNPSDLMSKHTNLTVVSASSFKSKGGGDDLVKEVCITLHCLLKGYIPFEEERFPSKFGKFQTDIREGFCSFKMQGSSNFMDNQSMDVDYHPEGERPHEYNARLLMGSGIGRKGQNASGTLGGFVFHEKEGMCFLTCAHVAGHEGTEITQPAECEIANNKPCRKDHTCGRVVKRHFDGGVENAVGVDAALIQVISDNRIPKNGQFIFVNALQREQAGEFFKNNPCFQSGDILDETKLTPSQRNMGFVKYGASTFLTKGMLKTKYAHERILDPNKNEYTVFYNQLEVVGVGEVFFAPGDSGSLVFLWEDGIGLRCLGLAIANTSYGTGIVTPINHVLKVFGLTKLHRFLDA